MPDIPAAPVPALLPALDRVDLHAPVFISDLHLCAQRARTLRVFLDFVAGGAGHARELVILGDLFEYWAGDDALDGGDEDDAVGIQVAQALAALVRGGVPVYLMHGNRDVLLGSRFLERSGARLLADPCLARIGPSGAQQAVLLSHGDAYCTLDLPYQAFRRQARDARFQAGFLAQPLAQRRALIGQARARSEAGKQQMAMDIMDVTPAAVDGALRAAGVQRLLHGHTHRPGHHAWQLDGADAQRWVLPDWEAEAAPARGGGLQWRDGALHVFSL